jgi:hypothetical protein
MHEQVNAARQELEARLLDKAGKDAAFRRALLSDPKGTLGRELGVSLPEGLAVTVVEEAPGRCYLVLPAAAAHRTEELSDAELEAVAGGSGEPHVTQQYIGCAITVPKPDACGGP